MGGRESFEITNDHIIATAGSTTGSQKKYFHDNKYFKLNCTGYEDVAEFLASELLSASNEYVFVHYSLCTVNCKDACYSTNFLLENEQLITFEKLFYAAYGKSLTDCVMHLTDAEEKIKFVIDEMKALTSLDLTEYLQRVCSLDSIILNHDRHFNNLAVVYDTDLNIYRLAPIFDNGAGLLSNYNLYEPYEKVSDLVYNVIGKPFCANLEYQSYLLGNPLQFSAQKLSRLKDYDFGRATEVLKLQLSKHKQLIVK